jgi:hypothetical protein
MSVRPVIGATVPSRIGGKQPWCSRRTANGGHIPHPYRRASASALYLLHYTIRTVCYLPVTGFNVAIGTVGWPLLYRIEIVPDNCSKESCQPTPNR